METQGSQFFENIVQTARNYVNKIIVFYKNKLQNADNKPMFITIVNSLISAKKYNIPYFSSIQEGWFQRSQPTKCSGILNSAQYQRKSYYTGSAPSSQQSLPPTLFPVPKTTAYKWWIYHIIRPENCCHLIPSNCLLGGFPDPSQFSAAKLTHYSTMPHRPSDSSRPRQRLLLSGDVQQNPGPATSIHVPCVQATSWVSYMCNRCSRWVHSKCSGLQNAAEYR